MDSIILTLPRGKDEFGRKRYLSKKIEEMNNDEFCEWVELVYPLSDTRMMSDELLADNTVRMQIYAAIETAGLQNTFSRKDK